MVLPRSILRHTPGSSRIDCFWASTMTDWAESFRQEPKASSNSTFRDRLGTSPPLLEFQTLRGRRSGRILRLVGPERQPEADEHWRRSLGRHLRQLPQTIVGSTIGSYEQALDDVASYLSQIGDATGDVPQLLSLLIAQAANVCRAARFPRRSTRSRRHTTCRCCLHARTNSHWLRGLNWDRWAVAGRMPSS